MTKSRPKKHRDFKKPIDRESESSSGRAESDSNKILTRSRALFLTIAATVMVYANSLSGAFVFDDTKQIAGNPSLRSWSNALRGFTTDVWNFQRQTLSTDIPPPYYRPLFTVYLMFNYQLFGLWEPGWHLMNLLVHATATALVYSLAHRLSHDNLVALVTALLFGLHPAHVESVSWISGIPDPLAALFYIASFLWYVRYRQEGDRKWLVGSVVAYGLAALCKETPLVLPLVLAVWELAQPQNKKGLASRLTEILTRLAPYAVVAAGYMVLRFTVLGLINWQHPLMANLPAGTIWLTVPVVLASYLKHLFAPIYLSLIYGPTLITSFADWRFLLSLALLLGLGFLVWIYGKRLKAEEWIGIGLMVAPLVLVLNLRVFHPEYIIQDRYLYLPSIGFCFLVAVWIGRLAHRRIREAAAISIIIALAFGTSTVLQNRIWNNSVALWQRAVNYSPESRSTHYNLGLAYLGRKQYDSAFTEMLEARRLDPQRAAVYNNLALAEAGLGKLDDAIANLETAVKLEPASLEAHNNLGALLYDKGDYEGSRREFALVLERDPASSSARFNLGRTKAALNDHAGAIREYEALLVTGPNDVVVRYQLAMSYVATGRKVDAVAEFGRALAMDHDSGRAAEMRRKLEQIQSQ